LHCNISKGSFISNLSDDRSTTSSKGYPCKIMCVKIIKKCEFENISKTFFIQSGDFILGFTWIMKCVILESFHHSKLRHEY
jgi:hypothetical protein